jgi:pumilio RNA-binding family
MPTASQMNDAWFDQFYGIWGQEQHRDQGRWGHWRRTEGYQASPVLRRIWDGDEEVTLQEVLDALLDVAYDRAGAAWICERLADSPEKTAEAILAGARPHVLSLATHEFGREVVTALIERASASELKSIVSELFGYLLDLSRHPHGCRVVQHAIEHCAEELQGPIQEELFGEVVNCIESAHANFVIQKCIQSLPQSATRFIVQEVGEQAVYLARHRFGCRVHQRILEHASESDVRSVLAEVMRSRNPLTCDEFGNYVVQHILEFGPADLKEAVVKTLLSDIGGFGSHKHSSNVVEKAMAVLPGVRDRVIAAILAHRGCRSPLAALAASKYGNFVIQHILEDCTPEQRKEVGQRLRAMGSVLRRGFGKHLMPLLGKSEGRV